MASSVSSADWKEQIQRGRFNDAADALRQHLIDWPEDLDAREELGVVFARMRRFPEAADQFKAVLDRDPHRLGALRNLSRAYADQNQLAEAEKYLLQLVEREPQSAQAHRSLGEQSRQGRFVGRLR